MLIAGALAGLAGGVEVLGVHHRLIEGFSLGFGFKAVTVALLGALEPLAVVPAALFVGLLEAGSLSMQRQIGVPSALVVGDRGPDHAVRARRDGAADMIDFLAAAIRIATPLLLAALGGILSERAGVFAVGLEGMMLAGAFAAIVGAWASDSALVGVAARARRRRRDRARRSPSWRCAIRADNMVTGLAANILAARPDQLSAARARRRRPAGRHPSVAAAPWPIPGLADLPVLGPLLFAHPPLTYLAVARLRGADLFL